jgi:hypothetical protein
MRIDASQPVDDGMSANQDVPKATLRGRWLLAARASWVTVATLTLGLVTTGIVVAFNQPDPAVKGECPAPRTAMAKALDPYARGYASPYAGHPRTPRCLEAGSPLVMPLGGVARPRLWAGLRPAPPSAAISSLSWLPHSVARVLHRAIRETSL